MLGHQYPYSSFCNAVVVAKQELRVSIMDGITVTEVSVYVLVMSLCDMHAQTFFCSSKW